MQRAVIQKVNLKFYTNFSLSRMCILQNILIIGNKEMRKHYAFTDIRKEE